MNESATERQHLEAGKRLGRWLGAAALGAAMLAASPAGADELGPNDPIAGWTEQTAFLRSPGNNFVLFPSGRLQVDAYTFVRPTNDMPVDSILLRRARLELTGWVGPFVYYSVAGDFAAAAPAGADPIAQSFLAATDNYVALAPFGDRVILQAGQFDAPFTLENRTSDKYFDFMERPITVRAFGVPSNKEVGAMVHGLPLLNKGIYYSFGAFNGDGQNFKNVDNNFDLMGRAWIAPFALAGIEPLEKITIGGSFWYGQRDATGLPLATQTTQGGFAFTSPKFTLPDGKTSAELHQKGELNAYAFEVNVPIMHRFGVRFEYVYKKQGLAEQNIANAANGSLTLVGLDTLEGSSFYGEAWGWILGDDRIIGDPGLQMPVRLKKMADPPPKHGLMVAARVDNLEQRITPYTVTNKDPNAGYTHVIAPELGINYWYSRRFRATFNYVMNFLDGDTTAITKARTKNGNNAIEHEMLFRLGIAL